MGSRIPPTASPASGGPQDHARAAAAGLRGLESDGPDAFPDGGDVLDADPVVLDILAVGQVGGNAGELGGELTEARSCSADSAPPSQRIRIMKWLLAVALAFLVGRP